MKHSLSVAAPSLAAVVALAAGAAAPAGDALVRPYALGMSEASHESCAHTPHELTRDDLLATLAHAPMCFPGNISKEELQRLIDETDLLPPAQFFPIHPGERFFTDSTVWTGYRAQGPAERAQPAFLMYSFADDGTIWGLSQQGSTGPSVLGASLRSTFGQSNLDLGREHFRQALASWRAYTGLDYREVADDGVPMNQTIPPTDTRGDIRIGGLAFGTSTFLAYNAFPSPDFAGVGGGDMVMNTSFFIPNNFGSSANSYRYLRNTVAHEHGHGLGAIHVVPCNNTKLMEPAIHTDTVDGISIDATRFGQRNYGDRFAGNHAASNAKDFGTLDAPVLRSVIERSLSTNGVNGFGDTNQDWFRFSIDESREVTITVVPTGGTYSNGQQFFSCFGFDSSVNASQAGNLNLELRSADGTTVIQASASGGPGATESVSLGSLDASEYTVRVVDVGPNNHQTLQLYDLTIRVDGAAAPPFAVAGISKRIAAGENCFFLGDINTRRAEGAGTLTYDWDLDGDGVFEVLDDARPVTQYVSNGEYEVALRVTDQSSGLSATDSITVDVFGGETTLTAITPDAAMQGTNIPVVITGTNLRNVQDASEFSVSGSGVAIVGTPVPNGAGTSIDGLSLEVDHDAAIGFRDLTITNDDGTATLVGAIEVAQGMGSCDGDANGDGVIDFADLNIVLNNFGQTGEGLSGDLDGDGSVGFSDLNQVLNFFGQHCI